MENDKTIQPSAGGHPNLTNPGKFELFDVGKLSEASKQRYKV